MNQCHKLVLSMCINSQFLWFMKNRIKDIKNEVTGVSALFFFRFQDYLYIMHARPQQVRRQLTGQPIRSLHFCYVYSPSGQADSVCYCCSRIPVLLKFQSVCLYE